MELDDLDRELIAAIMDAVHELERAGTPLKDYLYEDDVKDAMKLLAQYGKSIGLTKKQRPT